MKQNTYRTTRVEVKRTNKYPKGLGLNKATLKWRSVCTQSTCIQCDESSTVHLIKKYTLAGNKL